MAPWEVFRKKGSYFVNTTAIHSEFMASLRPVTNAILKNTTVKHNKIHTWNNLSVWFCSIKYIHVTVHLYQLKILSPLKSKLYAYLARTSYTPPLGLCSHYSNFSFYELKYFRCLLKGELCNICPFVTVFFFLCWVIPSRSIHEVTHVSTFLF